MWYNSKISNTHYQNILFAFTCLSIHIFSSGRVIKDLLYSFHYFPMSQVLDYSQVLKAPCTVCKLQEPIFFCDAYSFPLLFPSSSLNIFQFVLSLSFESWIICCCNKSFNKCKCKSEMFCAFGCLTKWISKYLEHTSLLLLSEKMKWQSSCSPKIFCSRVHWMTKKTRRSYHCIY